MTGLFEKILKDWKKKIGLVICFLTIILLFSVSMIGSIDKPKELLEIEAITLIVISFLGSVIIFCFDFSWHNLAFLIIVLFGGINCFIMPILNSPDEQAHFARAEMTSRGNFILEPEKGMEDFTVIQTVDDFLTAPRKTKLETDIDDLPINYQQVPSEWMASNNPFFGYLPQAIGINIAKTLSLNAIWLLWLGRFINLLFFAWVVRFAIKIIPVFKIQLFLVACLPMSVFQGSSMSIDVMINGLAFLAFAYFIKLNSQPEKTIVIRDIACYFIVCVLLSVAKVTCAPLIVLIAFIPIKKFKSNKNYFLALCTIFFVGVIALVWFGYTLVLNSETNALVSQGTMNSYALENNVNAIEQLRFVVQHPLQIVRVLGKALFDVTALNQSLFTFGWLSYSVPGIDSLFLMLFGASIILYPNNVKIAKKTRIGAILTCLFVFIATELALYISWTPVGSGSILGVQGRYYIPILCLFAVALGCNNEGLYLNKQNNFSFDILIKLSSVTFLAFMLLQTIFIYY